ncbi:MAG: nucleotidyltransferase substrate binding protein [Clostridiales bacterium]|nr:nucleotidyltransferase substrate binding protein [Clostridiales bacterium]
MDERFTRRYESFKNSLNALSEAKTRDLSDSFVLSGTGSKYSITFELAWKTMKDILVQYYEKTDFITGSPREVLKLAFKFHLIEDDVWMEMLRVKNLLAHDYNGEVIEEFCKKIISIYTPEFFELRKTIDALLCSEDS